MKEIWQAHETAENSIGIFDARGVEVASVINPEDALTDADRTRANRIALNPRLLDFVKQANDTPDDRFDPDTIRAMKEAAALLIEAANKLSR